MSEDVSTEPLLCSGPGLPGAVWCTVDLHAKRWGQAPFVGVLAKRLCSKHLISKSISVPLNSWLGGDYITPSGREFGLWWAEGGSCFLTSFLELPQRVSTGPWSNPHRPQGRMGKEPQPRPEWWGQRKTVVHVVSFFCLMHTPAQRPQPTSFCPL